MATLNQKTTPSEKSKTKNLLLLAVSLFLILGGFLTWSFIERSNQPEIEEEDYNAMQLPENFEERLTSIVDSIDPKFLVPISDLDPEALYEKPWTLYHSPKSIIDSKPDIFHETPGDFVYSMESFQFNELVGLLISNDSEVIISFKNQILTTSDEDNIVRVLESDRITSSIQWNKDGDRILVEYSDTIVEYRWPEWEVVREIQQPEITGKVAYHPTDEDLLWMMSSELNFDANETVRSLTDIYSFDWSADFQPVEEHRFRPYSMMGTFPTIDTAWALDYQPQKMIPASGNIQELDLSSGLLFDDLTTNTTEIDFFPQAASDGSFVFIRSEAFPENPDTLISARAYYKPADSFEAILLTSEPSARVAISPDGNYFSTMVCDIGSLDSWKIMKSSFGDVDFDERKKLQADWENLKQQFKDVEDKLAKQFILQLRLGQTLEEESIFNPEVIERSSQYFGDSMSEFVELENSIHSLQELDNWLNLMHGVWSESLSTVYYSGAYYGESIVNSEWALSTATMALSSNQLETKTTPILDIQTTQNIAGKNETAEAFFAFHFPFYVVRERLAGRVSLFDESMGMHNERKPIFIVENDSPETIKGIVDEFSNDAENEVEKLYKQQFDYSQAEWSNDPALLLKSSLNLVELASYNPDFLLLLSEQLSIFQYDDEAITLAKYAISLDHKNPENVYKASTIFRTIGDYEKAIALIEHLQKIDIFNEFTDEANESLDQIKELILINSEQETESLE